MLRNRLTCMCLVVSCGRVCKFDGLFSLAKEYIVRRCVGNTKTEIIW